MSQRREDPCGDPGEAHPRGRPQREFARRVATPATERRAGRGHRHQQARGLGIERRGQGGARERVTQWCRQRTGAALLVGCEHRAYRFLVHGRREHRRQTRRPRGRSRVPRRRRERRRTPAAQRRTRFAASRASHGQHQIGPRAEQPMPFHASKLARPGPKRTPGTGNHPIRSWRAVAGDRTCRKPANRGRPGSRRCALWSSCCPATAGRRSPRWSPRAAAGRRRPGPRCAASR